MRSCRQCSEYFGLFRAEATAATRPLRNLRRYLFGLRRPRLTLSEDPTRCFRVSGSPFVNRNDPKPGISLRRLDNEDQREGPERDGKKRKAGLDSKEETKRITTRVQGKLYVVAGNSPDLERTCEVRS